MEPGSYRQKNAAVLATRSDAATSWPMLASKERRQQKIVSRGNSGSEIPPCRMPLALISSKWQEQELQRLRLLGQKLRTELFDGCCALQHDPESVDKDQLLIIVDRLRIIDDRTKRLEQAIRALLPQT